MRVALITGGTRGIGAAISIKLKEAGYKVAAIYAGNDDVATKFSKENEIAVFKWSIANYEECVAGIKSVEEKLGPIDVLVNNAGITRDGMFHKMSQEQWRDVINVNLNGLFNMTQPSLGWYESKRIWKNCKYFFNKRTEGTIRTSKLFRSKSWRTRFHKITGP